MIQLRDYQVKAVDAIEEELSEHKSTLLVCATGGGKTIMFSEVARRYTEKYSKRVLVIAHMETLLNQAEKAFRANGFRAEHIGFEVAGRKVNRNHIPLVVLASKDSLHMKRLQRYERDTFGLIIVDEADLSVTKTWRNVIEYFGEAKVLGVTATPKRTDGKRLRNHYESVADVIEILDLIERGYLVPITQNYVPSETIDLSDIQTSKGGDFREDQLDEILNKEASILELARVTIEEAEDRPTCVFCTNVKNARHVAEVINRHRPGKAAAISGEDSVEDRGRILKAFERGELQYLCNCVVLTRGVDMPWVSHLVIGRPTKSLTLYTQIIGRGTRLYGETLEESIENGKPNLLVTDLVGVSGKHRLITAADLLSPNNEELADKAKEIIKKAGGGDVREALEQAEAELLEEQRTRAAALIAKQVKYERREVSPFGVLGIYDRQRGIGEPLTINQANTLRKFKVPEGEIRKLDKGQASLIIDGLIKAVQSGGASYKQRALLIKHGLNPNVSFAVASDMINEIANNGWNVRGIEHLLNALSDAPSEWVNQ